MVVYNVVYSIHCVSGEHQTEEYKKINPFGLVPVIDDNGFILTERYMPCMLILTVLYS